MIDAAGYSKSQGGTNACGDCLDGYSGITGPVTTDEVCTEFVPSCENGALDSDESDIDCGGICKVRSCSPMLSIYPAISN